MPMITVKQPDGTLAKISLEEFMKQRTAAPLVAASTAAPVSAAPVSAVPVAAAMQHAGTSAPAAQSLIPSPAITKPSAAALSALPLKAPMPQPAIEQKKPASPPVADRSFIKDLQAPSSADSSAARDADLAMAETVLSELSFSVPLDHRNRLVSVVRSRLKAVRSPEEARTILVRNFEDGGVGLSEPQADEVLRMCTKHESVMIVPAQMASTTAPFNAFKHPAADTKPPAPSVPREQPRPSLPPEPSRAVMPDRLRVRPSVTDVVYKPVAIGPIEEIRAITLTDFRRLSPVHRDAALRLEQKFTNLKAESIVLFFQALDAWRQSPLYLEYTDRALSALLYRKGLEHVLQDAKGITLDEVGALVGMEKHLTA